MLDDQNNPDQTQNGGETPSQDSQQTPIQPIQPTPQPTDPRTDPAYLKLVEDTMRVQNQRIAEMQKQLDDRNAPPPIPTKTKEELRTAFYDDPIGATRSMIREELNETIAPLKDFVSEFRTVSVVDRKIKDVKARYAAQWGPKLEAYVRTECERMEPDKLSDALVDALVLAGIGLKTTGRLIEDSEPPRDSVPPRDSTTRNMQPPPHLRPSAPPGPSSSDGKPKYQPLNELELRLLREYNSTKPKDKQMTEEQYRIWQSMDARDVATTTFDRPTPPGGR